MKRLPPLALAALLLAGCAPFNRVAQVKMKVDIPTQAEVLQKKLLRFDRKISRMIDKGAPDWKVVRVRSRRANVEAKAAGVACVKSFQKRTPLETLFALRECERRLIKLLPVGGF